MHRLLRIGTAAALLAASSVGASAQDTIPWDVPEVRGWTIAIDTTLGGGCFMYTIFDGDASSRIGFDLQAGNIYLLLADLDWSSIAADQSYDIELQMGNQPSWTASASGGRMGDVPTLMLTSTDSAFMEEFAAENSIKVWYKKNEIMHLSLQGSKAAMNELLRCQDAVNAALTSGIDGGASVGADPFAN
jgi:hypothetical protein